VKTFVVTAVDHAGNTASTSVQYSVVAVSQIPPTRVFVSGWQLGRVSVLDGTTHEVITHLPLNAGALTMAFDRRGSHLYVLEGSSSTLATIDLQALTVTGRAAVGQRPYAVAQTYDSSALYVANFDDGTVTILRTNELAKTVATGPGPISVLATPDRRHMLVANLFSNTISVFDATTDVVVQTLTIPGGPAHLTASPDGQRIVVTAQSRRIYVIDASTFAPLTDFDAHGDVPEWAAFSPDGQDLFVTYPLPGAPVVRMNSYTGQYIASLNAGGYPGQVSASPHGLRA
jgi:YVTN family beta-propeller protein